MKAVRMYNGISTKFKNCGEAGWGLGRHRGETGNMKIQHEIKHSPWGKLNVVAAKKNVA